MADNQEAAVRAFGPSVQDLWGRRSPVTRLPKPILRGQQVPLALQTADVAGQRPGLGLQKSLNERTIATGTHPSEINAADSAARATERVSLVSHRIYN